MSKKYQQKRHRFHRHMSGYWGASTPSHKGIDPNRGRMADQRQRSIIKEDVRDSIFIDRWYGPTPTKMALLLRSESEAVRLDDHWADFHDWDYSFMDDCARFEKELDQEEHLEWYNDVNQ